MRGGASLPWISIVGGFDQDVPYASRPKIPKSLQSRALASVLANVPAAATASATHARAAVHLMASLESKRPASCAAREKGWAHAAPGPAARPRCRVRGAPLGHYALPVPSADLRATLCEAYPAVARHLDAHPEDLAPLARGTRQARDARTYRRLAATAVGDLSDLAAVRRGLRRFASREKLRIATRELLAHPGQDVDVTARELADLADVCCEVALAEALSWAEGRFGPPLAAGGERCPFVVVGMGKLGGRELNAGSDVDLMLFYDTDDGEGGEGALHERFTRVAQRFVATLDEPTEDGVVWRVDLRLRPEGTRGPLVNALAAAERYYETWGRTWERAALVRARPVAGDLAFGARLLEVLAPFVWRRAVDPRIVGEMAAMLARSRAEAGDASEGDLKIGPGGSARWSSSRNRSSSCGAGASRACAARTRSTRSGGCGRAASSPSARRRSSRTRTSSSAASSTASSSRRGCRRTRCRGTRRRASAWRGRWGTAGPRGSRGSWPR